MRSSEILIAAYFGYLLLAATGRGPVAGRRVVALSSACLLAGLAGVTRLPATPAGLVIRDWMPLVFLVTGYWLPKQLMGAANERLEQALLSIDRRLFSSDWTNRPTGRGRRLVLEYLELAYLFCYPLVPLAFAALYFTGHEAETNRFWTAVLLAVYPCYGLLPWLPTRPPRARADDPLRVNRASWVRGANVEVLSRLSVQANTFPSGHAAASLAAALVVTRFVPTAGAGFVVIALSIAVASVVGRYHYALDAILGVVLALAAWGVASLPIS